MFPCSHDQYPHSLTCRFAETAKFNLGNHNCKQIILGVSHDAGYAPFLDEILRDELTRRRITVLEGFPTVRELVATGVNILNLNDTLFRAEKLVDRAIRNPTPPMMAPLPPPVPLNSPPVVAAVPVRPPSSTVTPTVPPQPTSYARATKAVSPPPQITLPLQPKAAVQKSATPVSKPQPWKPGARGMDPPMQVSQTALDNIKKRKDSSKLCNNHYLRGPCSKGDSCCFEHKYKPSMDEIKAIAFLARLNPCTSGQECEVKDCIYGHHVSSVLYIAMPCFSAGQRVQVMLTGYYSAPAFGTDIAPIRTASLESKTTHQAQLYGGVARATTTTK